MARHSRRLKKHEKDDHETRTTVYFSFSGPPQRQFGLACLDMDGRQVAPDWSISSFLKLGNCVKLV